MTIEELEEKVLQLEESLSLLSERQTRNEMIAVALVRLLFKQGILPLTQDLKDLLIEPEEE